MKADQLAWYAHNEEQVVAIKKMFGLLDKPWVEDQATGKLVVRRNYGSVVEGQSVGHLRFNYDLGIELEILTYLEGPHWHEERPEFLAGQPFLSHVGIHMDDESEKHWDKASRIVQDMWTIQHTNPYLLEKGRKYHYQIRDTVAQLGHFTKYIWRIEKEHQK